MIKVEFSLFVALYLAGWLLLLFFFWWREKVSADTERLSMKNKFLRRCSVCTYTYFLSLDLSLSRCPLCGSWNKLTPQDSLKK